MVSYNHREIIKYEVVHYECIDTLMAYVKDF